MANLSIQMNMLNESGEYDVLSPYVGYKFKSSIPNTNITNVYYDFEYYNGSNYRACTDFKVDINYVITTYDSLVSYHIIVIIYSGDLMGNRKYRLKLKENYYLTNEKIFCISALNNFSTNKSFYVGAWIQGNFTQLDNIVIDFMSDKDINDLNGQTFSVYMLTMKIIT